MKTLIVNINREGFEYDIHSLVKAFFSDCEVKVLFNDTTISSDEGVPDIFVNYINDKEILCSIVGAKPFEAKKLIADGLDSHELKNSIKRLLYECCSEYLDRKLPWGGLTGIRPTKIARELLDSGSTEDETLQFMKEYYLVSDEKSELSVDIAQRERSLLAKLHPEKGYSLYIGIPFCPTTCLYCSFTSYPICSWKNRVPEYLKALFKEIDYVAESFKDKTLDTVYIGGGTPTTLEPDELDELLGYLTSKIDMSDVLEFTVEAGRPDSITKDKMAVLKKYNVTRVSVNPQTMNQKTLDYIGRRHTVEETIDIFNMVRGLGFDNINMDIILGLPGENVDEVAHTIEVIKELKPDNLTVHSLAIKRASRMAQWIEENGFSMINNTDDTMEVATKGARDMGMKPYYLYRQKNMSGNFENTGYALPGKEGLYNILIMEEVQTIVACGAGTVTKRVYGDGRIERCDNVKDVNLYISKIEEMIDRKRQLFAD